MSQRLTAKITFLIAVCCPCTNGTTIVVERLPSGIVIGADSANFETQAQVTTQVCKIATPSDRLAFAATGLANLGREGLFDAYLLAFKAAAGAKTVPDVAKEFEGLAAEPLQFALNLIMQRDPKLISEMQKWEAPLQVVFVGMDDTTPAYVLSQFNMSVGPEGITVTHSEPISCPGNGGPTDDCPGQERDNPRQLHQLILGQNTRIKQLTDDQSYYKQFGVNLPSIVYTLISAEISAQPSDQPPKVGGPISMLAIDQVSGFHWLNKGICPLP